MKKTRINSILATTMLLGMACVSNAAEIAVYTVRATGNSYGDVINRLNTEAHRAEPEARRICLEDYEGRPVGWTRSSAVETDDGYQNIHWIGAKHFLCEVPTMTLPFPLRINGREINEIISNRIKLYLGSE